MSIQPFEQFEKWFQDASLAQVQLPEAMTLATVDDQGVPDARIVLLKEFGLSGFVFFTNYESPKGIQLEKNPHAAAVFWWSKLERQIRIRGSILKVSAKQSDAYAQTRPKGSQIAAWVSKQSSVIQNREELEQAYQQFEKKFADALVPRPSYWGGYCLVPNYFEFWQGRENRLHERCSYRLDQEGSWRSELLSP